jgi:hypothetical protein
MKEPPGDPENDVWIAILLGSFVLGSFAYFILWSLFFKNGGTS